MAKSIELKHTNVFKRSFDALNDKKVRFIIEQGGTRCHAKGTLIRMFDGSLKKVEDIKIGDRVASWNGLSSNEVIELHNGFDDLYRIKQNKGEDYIVNGSHILCLKQVRPKYKKKMINGKCILNPIEFDKDEFHYFRADEWSKRSLRSRRIYSGFKNTFLEFPKKELTIDPYYLGLWLGDGSSSFAGGITTGDDEIIDYLKEISILKGYNLNYDGRYTYRFSDQIKGVQIDLSKEFHKLNLIKNKHIPADYIYSSYEDRLKLIAGLVDSDGHHTGRNTLSITQINFNIIKGLKEILEISGFYTRGINQYTAKMKREDGSIYEVESYSIEFNHPDFKNLNQYIKIPRKKISKDHYEGFDIFTTKIESEYIGRGEVFGFSLDSDEPLYKLADGTITHNSSKTYSLCQLMIVYCLTNKNKVVSIVRKSFPSLRGSVMRDFFEVMNDLGIYNEKNHNKTEHIYQFDNGSMVEFFAVDDEQKLRGRKRNILWANEANELDFEEFNQLNLRTSDKLIFDFNPSDNFHWLYDLIPRDESILIKSTYKDNPFLSESIIKEIENLKNVDEGYYRVYALGEKGVGKTTIYTHWKFYDGRFNFEDAEVIYGLDFGYNNPTSLIEIKVKDGVFLINEVIYETGFTGSDIVKRMNELNISKKKEIVCDGARPEIIEELKRAGYNAKVAIKDVKAGIDNVKSSELYITKSSLNLIKEIGSYKWKVNGDLILDEPVKVWDHAMDALRYGIHYWKIKHRRSDSNNFRIRF